MPRWRVTPSASTIPEIAVPGYPEFARQPWLSMSLDLICLASRLIVLKPIKVKELLKILRQHGCEEVRQVGSYLIGRYGNSTAVLVIHGKEVAPGTLRNIRETLESCLGKGWIK